MTKSLVKHAYPSIQHTAATPWIILCDFDGTISVDDTTDVLLQRFGLMGWEALEDDWLAGLIGSRECMGSQIGLLDMTALEFYQRLDQMAIDPDFKEFTSMASRFGVEVQIVSDGLDSAIQYIMKRHGLDRLPVYANHLVQQDERRWALEFPYANENCLKASGNCKCARAASVQITPQLTSQRVLYIGDGSSDFCVSNRVDVVLAKDKLIDYCRDHEITHYPIQNFNDALAILPEILMLPAPDQTAALAEPVVYNPAASK